MTAGLETFAKVRALHDRATIPGEKAAAMTRMQTLARKAGLSVDEAVSRLDAPKPKTQAQATADAFNDFFNTPEMRAERAEREAARKVKAAAIVERYGSEDAVFADTSMEAALRAACEPLLGLGETWRTIYRLDGWGTLDSRAKMPASVREAVLEAWPLPDTVAEAWTEFEANEALLSDRYTVEYDFTPDSFTDARRYVVEDLLNTLPARSLDDIRARLSWLEWWNRNETSPDVEEDRKRLATLRADIERMGERIQDQPADTAQSEQSEDHAARHTPSDPPPVQSGHAEGWVSNTHPLCSPVSGTTTSPVQSGHAHRTTADKRRDVFALLTGGESLTDREIARRAGVSPTTVGTIRRSLV